MNRLKVKTRRRFDLTILKINQIHYKRIEVFTKDLPKSNAISSSNLLTLPCANFKSTKSFSSWIYHNTSRLAWDFEISLKGFKSLSVMILMQQLHSTNA